MSDTSKTLDILIRTKAELAGAQQLEQALERDIGKAKALGKVDEVQRLTGDLEKVRAAQKNAVVETAEAIPVDEEHTMALKDKKEALRALGDQFGVAGGMVGQMFNPLALSITLMGAAFALWNKRVEMAADAMGNLDLPDLDTGIRSAHNLAEAWSGVEDAVRNAKEKYDSAESVFGRETQVINAETTALKNLLEAQKKQALARLDLDKNSMTPESYAVRRAEIEQAFGDQSKHADQIARQRILAAKADAAAKARADAAAKEAAANAIKLPEDDQEFSAQQESLKKRAEAYRKLAEEQGKAREELQNLQIEIADGLGGKIKSVPGAIKFGMEHGYNMTGGEAIALHGGQERDANSIADAIERTIAARDRLKKKRDELRTGASQAAGTATDLENQLAHDKKINDITANGDNRAESINRNAASTQVVADALNKNGEMNLDGLSGIERAVGISTTAAEKFHTAIVQKHLSLAAYVNDLARRLEVNEANTSKALENTWNQ